MLEPLLGMPLVDLKGFSLFYILIEMIEIFSHIYLLLKNVAVAQRFLLCCTDFSGAIEHQTVNT